MFWKKQTFLKTSFIKKDVRTTGGPILSRDRVVDSLWPKKNTNLQLNCFFFHPFHQNSLPRLNNHLPMIKISPGGLLGRRTEYAPTIFFWSGIEIKIV